MCVCRLDVKAREKKAKLPVTPLSKLGQLRLSSFSELSFFFLLLLLLLLLCERKKKTEREEDQSRSKRMKVVFRFQEVPFI